MLKEAMGIIYGVQEEREIKEKRDRERDIGKDIDRLDVVHTKSQTR